MIACVATAGTLAVVRETRPAPGHSPPGKAHGKAHGKDGTAVPIAVARSATPVRATLRVPEPKVAPATAVTANPPKPSQIPAKTAMPLRDEPRLPAVAPVPETPKARVPAVTESRVLPLSPPLAASTERPLNTTPPSSAELTVAPPVIAPAITPRADLSPFVAPPLSTPAPPVAPAPLTAHSFIGPQVIHQVNPAVPRGVGPMITTDVQLDVVVAIDAKGKVTGARVASTKGTAATLLTIEALKAAQLFRFRPAQENGRDVASSMVLTFRFARASK